MSEEWYCRVEDVVYGPLTAADLVRMAQTKALSRADLVQKTAKGKWMRADAVKGLAFPPPAVPPPLPARARKPADDSRPVTVEDLGPPPPPSCSHEWRFFHYPTLAPDWRRPGMRECSRCGYKRNFAGLSGWYDIPEEEAKEAEKRKARRDYNARVCAARGHAWSEWAYESYLIDGMGVTEEESYQRTMREAQREASEKEQGKLYTRRCQTCAACESERRRD